MKIMRKNGIKKLIAYAMLAALILTATVGMYRSTASAQEVTEMSSQNATITADSVRVRSGAGTSYDVLGNMSQGEATTVSGQATDSEGNVWYRIDFNGSAGFVRNDFLQLGDVVEADTTADPAGGDGTATEPTEETPVEEVVEEQPEPQPEETAPIVSSQYVALYEEDDQGTYYWYLHNNDEGYRVKIDDLLAAARSVDEIDAIEKQNKTLKTALIIVGIVLAVLVVVLVILIFRLRDYMYYEGEEEDEDEEPPHRGGGGSFIKRRRDDDLDEDDDEPPLRQRAGRGGRDYAEEQPRTAGRTARPSPDARPAGREAGRGRDAEPGRRSRNFADDDLEYEFLNLDDE